MKVGILASSAYYGYLFNRCKKLKEEYTDYDVIKTKMDTTRPTNLYYGINWGYRSDETIEKSLDTGNLIYFNYDCDNCFSPKDVVLCKVQQKLKNITPEDS